MIPRTILAIPIFLGMILAAEFALAAEKTEALEPRTISADLRKVKGPLDTMFKRCVGAGRANEGLRADWQRQMAIAHKECGFEYVRMHGLFTDDMGVYREQDGKPDYNWQYIDELYDFLHGIGMKPFVELGFMPNALASGTQTIFWWKGNVTPPKDMKKWADFVRAFVEHVKERYGDAEVRTWKFEVWNEPNLDGFWMGNPEKKSYEEWMPGARAEYFKFYAATARAIKSVSPDYKVGGPATAGCYWVPEFIQFCKTNDVPVDFISTHTYGVDSGFLDEYGNNGTVLSPDPNSIFGDVKRMRDEIAKSALPKLDLDFTEWSSSYTPSDPFHDSYHSAAYILDKLRKCGDAAQAMSYWTFTDIFEESGVRWTPFHGGFGLINYQDIPKASFFAYQFLNRLGATELESTDAESWICTSPDGGMQALVWNFTYTHPGKKINNQDFYNHDLPSSPKDKVTLNLAHLAKGAYTLEVFKVGYRANDAYTAYLDLGAPQQLTRAQVAKLKAAATGAPESSTTVEVGDDGVFKKEIVLRDNDAVLVTLTPKHG